MSNTSVSVESRDYLVRGMTCAHCVMSVREEVSGVQGVRSVDIDLATGRMAVSGEHLDDSLIHAAVHDAGYDLVT
jgi:copper chaperone